MRLLITTQAVDRNDPILGFFHEWVRAIAQHCVTVHVICLKRGEYDLPHNVEVHSLGKEDGENRLKYVWRFIRFSFSLRKKYDVVFSHMNPHYIVLMGLFWKIARKRIFFWRNHAQMNVMTWIAAQYAERVFYTSPFACTRRFAHAVQMPVGIDTTRFTFEVSHRPKRKSVLFLGRLSPVKRPELFMRAIAQLNGYTISVYGDVPHHAMLSVDSLRDLAEGNATFHASVPNYETPALYRAHDIYVNLTPEGSMDKTVLEAAACGSLVLVTNRSFETLLPQSCMIRDATPKGIATAIQTLSALSDTEHDQYRIQLRTMVEREHALNVLVEKLFLYFTQTHD